MGILDTTSKILDTTARVLNEAAFGDIRNIFRNGDLYNFRMRPIGLYQKSYGFMIDHINRNIGNAEYVYDGYSTPIGELSNPFYNTIMRVPWFYLDDYKNSAANYLDYVRTTYGAALSVENINDNNLFRLSEEASAVGVVDGRIALEALVDNSDLIPNSNETGKDTKLGIVSGYYNRETLRNAQVANDERARYGFSITSEMDGRLGINTENLTVGKTYEKSINEETGRFEDDVFSPLIGYDNPLTKYDGNLVKSNYGNIEDIGYYSDFYNSLSNKSKGYYDSNVYAERKLYFPTKDKTYFKSLGILARIDEEQIRYVFSTLASKEEHSNISDASIGGVYVYTEREKGKSTNIELGSFNAGTKFSKYTSYGTGLTANDLLKKTNDGFKNGNYKTIIARFHTDASEAKNTDTTQTAISKEFGLSHGRNLLKLNPDDSKGYNNPYCRVWTFHHQYHRLEDAIRPIPYDAETLYSKYNFNTFTADHSQKGFENGRVRLEKHGALNKNNGLVNITPIESGDASKKVDIKNCMFSIENLAWKDAFSTDASSRETFQAGGLSSEQKGPFGGRIMWFPPYDLKFSENVNVNWNENNFIGRGEGIYTYTNTTRSGTLSFKILVDHPSIINYWENRGKFSNGDSVDDKESPEQQLLRFFAGCDMLTAKDYSVPESEPVTHDTMIPSPDSQVIKFFVFYPNNYSGIDDDSDFAMKYLTNGLGAGKTKDEKTNKTVDYRIPYEKSNSGYGGYEMRINKPISTNCAQESQRTGNLHIKDDKFGDVTAKLYVQEGDSTNIWWKRKWYYRVDNAYKNHDLKKTSYIDRNSSCLNSEAGLDKVAERFGVKDKNNLYSLADVYTAFEGGNASKVLSGLYNDKKRKTLLENKDRIYKIECIGYASNPGYDSSNNKLQLNRAETVKKWLLSKLKKIGSNNVSVSVGGINGGNKGINSGDASSESEKLWRCAEVNLYLKAAESKSAQQSVSERYMPTSTTEGTERKIEDYRQVNHVNTPQQTINVNSNMGIERIKTYNDLSSNKLIEERVLKDRISSIRMNHLSDNINGLALNLRSSVRNGNVNVNSVFNAIADFSEHSKHFQYDNLGFITNGMRGKSSYDYILNEMHDNAAQDEIAGLNNSLQDKTEISTSKDSNVYSTREGTNNNKITRYDNESRFFSMLEKEEPFLHHKISDKIKYFDPAFHSISPEGFNARLTFLQQCTRQGPTIGNSDNYTANNTANNLAFGRPPVCILRIGDFYYTKILIENMNIEFDPLVWDLNTEGIGVMPMIANVSLSFKFIGGSSLAGHIARLQNALSFNYYANTEVYDDRSELAEYDENGDLSKFGTKNLTI